MHAGGHGGLGDVKFFGGCREAAAADDFEEGTGQVEVHDRAKLTPDGEAFVVYANQLMQTWEAARRDVPRPEGLHKMLHIGGEVSLCNPLILSWAKTLREHLTQHALRIQISDGEFLLRQIEMGLLDAALVYQPEYWPGMQVEQLLEEKLIQIRRPALPEPYVYVDWGEDFRRQHDAALPDKARALRTDIDGLTFVPLGSKQPMTWEQSLAANYTDGIVVLHRAGLRGSGHQNSARK